MDSHEVVVHMEQRQHSHVIFDLLAERIGQSGEAAHVHPHIEVLALNVRSADVLRVWITGDNVLDDALTLRGAVALLAFRIVAEYLDQLSVINSAGERIGHRIQIHLVAVRRQLDAIAQSAFNVLEEVSRTTPRPSVRPSRQ